MQLTTPLAVFVLAGAAVAQSGCAAQTTLDQCVKMLKPQLDACDPNDWKCKCDSSTNLLTCYNNCPSDPDKFGVSQTNVQFCNAAKVYASSSSTGSMSATATGDSTAMTTSMSTESPTLPAGVTPSETSTRQTASETGSGAMPTSSTINGSGSGGAGMVGPSVGGLVVVLAGAVVML